MRDDSTNGVFFVAHKGLTEMNSVLEARQQYLPQRDTAHRTMLRYAVAPEARWRISSVEREQHFHLLGDAADASRGPAASARERFLRTCRQASWQPVASGRMDMDGLTQRPVGGGEVAFIDSGADAGFFQTLCQGEAANSAANDDDVEWRRYRLANGGASWMRGHPITP